MVDITQREIRAERWRALMLWWWQARQLHRGAVVILAWLHAVPLVVALACLLEIGTKDVPFMTASGKVMFGLVVMEMFYLVTGIGWYRRLVALLVRLGLCGGAQTVATDTATFETFRLTDKGIDCQALGETVPWEAFTQGAWHGAFGLLVLSRYCTKRARREMFYIDMDLLSAEARKGLLQRLGGVAQASLEPEEALSLLRGSSVYQDLAKVFTPTFQGRSAPSEGWEEVATLAEAFATQGATTVRGALRRFWTCWTPRGRASVAEFWLAFLFLLVVFAGVAAVMAGLHEAFGWFVSRRSAIWQGVWWCGVATVIPFCALCVRRFHDTGRSGWYLLPFLLIFPVGGWLFLLLFMLLSGQRQANRFGPVPRKVPEKPTVNSRQLLD